MFRYLLALMLAVTCHCAVAHAQVKPSRPNIVLVLADDLGYGDLGCYGQKTIQTPHLDRLASQAMRFTQHYAGSAVCAPSRCSLLMGLHTGHTYMRGNGDIALRPGKDTTLAHLLQKAGYTTAMIGKSSVACHSKDPQLPAAMGFDHFFGVLDHRVAHHYYPPVMWRNGQKLEYPNNARHTGDTYCHDEYLREAKRFVTEQAKSKKPFFLMYSMHLPHAGLQVSPDDWRRQYVGKVGEDRAVQQRHYSGTPTAKATFAGMVSRLDWEVGQLLSHLTAQGLDKDTIVIFTSDNGAHSAGGHRESSFNSSGPLRGEKRDLYEGGIRVPLLVRWPGKVRAGAVSDHVSAFWDYMPTLCELAGARTLDHVDGISFVPTLLGEPTRQKKHKYLYWEFFEAGGRRAVRIGDHKVIQYKVLADQPGKIQVYDLQNDLDESDDIAAKRPDLVETGRRLFEEARVRCDYAKFNWTDRR